MKKIASLLLSVIMLFSMCLPAFATDDKIEVDGLTDIPVIVVSGDGSPIVNKDGEVTLHYKNFLSEQYRDGVIDTLLQGLKDMLYPLVVEGLLTDNWDNFYDALYDAISAIFEQTLLDGNGEIPTDPESPGYKTDLTPSLYKSMEYTLTRSYNENSKYSVHSFNFYYDWRLDPFETVKKLHSYIEGIKEATGCSEVGLYGRCVGSSIVATYIKVYGMDGIRGVGFNGSVVNGSEILSEVISGGFEVDMNAVIRLLEDCNGVGLFAVDSLVIDFLDMLEKSGFYGIAKELAERTIYVKLVEGVTSALALSTFYTWPTYWTAVAPEDYQNALYYVFGPEGSEKRKQYAGLIEKLDRYDREVRQNLNEIYSEIDREGNISVMSKYDFQIVPLTKSYDKLGDQFASVQYTSFGATTASVYDTLSDEYIAGRVAENKGKYISPDKKIDASTCMFPDNTWFVKGSSHSHWSTIENSLSLEVIAADRQLTVDDTIYTQFMVYDYDTDTMSAMTEENCNKVYYTADKEADKPDNIFARLSAFIKSLINFVKNAFERIMASQENKENA